MSLSLSYDSGKAMGCMWIGALVASDAKESAAARYRRQIELTNSPEGLPDGGVRPGAVVQSELPGDVAVITLKSPSRLNAISSDMRRDLIAILSALDEAEGAQAIILTGDGDRAFSAGQDLSEAKRLGAEDVQDWVEEWAAVYRAILNLGTPTVAALNGYAVGAGFQVAAMCDLRIASTTAQVGMPEVDDAIPCITGSWSLANLLGRGQIADLVFTGRLLTADEMLRWGLVTQTVAPDGLLSAARSLAELLARKDRLAIRLDKAWLRRDLLDRLPAAVEAAILAHSAAFESGEPHRAMEAFLARRSDASQR